MKFHAVILPLLLFSLTSVHARDDAYYVWQQHWSSNVLAAVESETAASLYPLACVVPKSGKSTLTTIPWKRLSTLEHHYIPVIRIPLSAFKRPDLADELDGVILRLIRKMEPVQLTEIQLDLDCPERLLGRYLELLKAYRKAHPNLRLSITALPVHLKHKTFHKLADATDYYVIQIHGINVPREYGDPAELLNRTTADKALRQAEALGHPYRVALPCYAYELNFNPASGAFLFLTAEKTTRRTDTIKQRIATDHRDLVELHKITQAQGVIWFRLPVEGDRLCLPRPTLADIQSGKLPKDDVQCRIRPVSDSTTELELYNGNTIHAHQAVLKLSWPKPTGAYDLYRGIHASPPAPGRLPTEITVPMPPPGDAVKIGWFQANTNYHPNIEIILK